jgi:nucleotide-binding universal stress UspA family protein
MSNKRRSFESGHQRKYLIVVDDTEECDRAVYWAARRAARTKSGVLMLRVIETEGRNQQWLGVADIMRQEAADAANIALDKFSGRANGIAGITPERVIREGIVTEEILKLIDEDADIGILVLAAGTGKDGPGPLVSNIGKIAGSFPIPVAIVPGHLSDDELDAMS